MFPESENIEHRSFITEVALRIIRERIVLNEILVKIGLDHHIQNAQFLNKLQKWLL